MVRYVVSVLIGGLITFGLFYLMHALIALADLRLGDENKGRVIEFVRLKREETVQEKKREIPDKKPPDEPPPPPDLSFSKNDKPSSDATGFGNQFAMDGPDMGEGPSIGGAAADSDAIPLVRVDPQYPIRAAERGIEGWVVVEFTITPRGTVEDPKVIAYSPNTIFNQAAIRAVKRYKYNPKIEDGKPVSRPGIKVRLDFRLD